MVSGSNCCDPWTVHLFLRKPDGTWGSRQTVTFVRLDMTPEERLLTMRGHSRPHLLDWNRDGHTDLVLADSLWWKLQVSAGPLTGKSKVMVNAFPLPELPDRSPYDFQFADWDGDGAFDVLFASGYLNPEKTRWLYDIYWCRNTTRNGEPKFEVPVRLLTAPAQSGEGKYEAYAIVDRGSAGGQDLMVSVTKDWKRMPKKGWGNSSQLVLFQRRGGPNSSPRPVGK